MSWTDLETWQNMNWPSRSDWQMVINDAHRDYVTYMAAFYVLMQPVARVLFAADKSGSSPYTRHKATWKRFMMSYNWLMCFYSLGTFVLAVKSILDSRHGVFPDTLAQYDLGMMDELARVFWLSKWFEYIDTLTLIIMNRPVSLLQYFHHLGAPIDMWMLYNYRNPAAWIFVTFNSFIHTLMYAYYAATIMGTKLNAVKWLMTFLQIVQLVVGTSYSAWYPLHMKGYSASPMMMAGFAVSSTYTCSLVVLFLNFFIQSYILGGKSGKSAPAEKQKRK